MRKKADLNTSSFSTVLFLSSLFPAAFVAFNICAHFKLVGVSFLVVLISVTLWLGLFVTSAVSLYKDGIFTWGDSDVPTTNEIRFDFLVMILMGLVALSSRVISINSLKRSKKSVIKSLGYGLLIPTVSVLPYIFILWASLILIELL